MQQRIPNLDYNTECQMTGYEQILPNQAQTLNQCKEVMKIIFVESPN